MTENRVMPPVIPLDEVRALIAYVSDRAIAVDGKTIHDLERAVFDFERADDEEARFAANQAIRAGYSALTKITYPTARVTGRSLVDTRRVWHSTKLIVFYGVIFFGLAAATEILALYIADRPVPDEGLWRWLTDFHDYILDFLSPLFWGGLGASIYLLKRISDLAADQAFDTRLLQGYQSRIWIGALLGAIIAHVYDPAALGSGDTPLSANAIAFLTGLAVKVVYGALEKTVAGLTEAMNLDTLKTRPPRRRSPDDDGQ